MQFSVHSKCPVLHTHFHDGKCVFDTDFRVVRAAGAAGGGAARRAGGPTLHPGRFRGALLALRAQPAPQGQAAGSLQSGPLSVLLPSLPLSQEHPSKSHDMKRMFLPWGRCESRDIGGHLGPSVAGRQGLRARLRGWAVPGRELRTPAGSKAPVPERRRTPSRGRRMHPGSRGSAGTGSPLGNEAIADERAPPPQGSGA